MKKWQAVVTFPAVCLAGFSVTAGVSAGSSATTTSRSPAAVSHHPNLTDASPPPSAYKVNSIGETYGSPGTSKSPLALPDLIGVAASNGQLGYITKAAYLGPAVTRQEISSWPTEDGFKVSPVRTVPVYASNGTTQVGTFMIGGGTVTVIAGSRTGSTRTLHLHDGKLIGVTT